MNTQSITERLYAQADSELKQELDNLYEKVRRTFTDGSTKPIEVKGGYLSGTDNTSKKFVVDGHAALERLKEVAFALQQGPCRQKTVDDFMAKVNALATDIEELQSRIR